MNKSDINTYISSEFTLLEYEQLLVLAKTRFTFKPYTEVKNSTNFVVWRHDIDLSLEQALKLAQIEKKQNISSTYFLHLHNEFYNVLDINSSQLVREILSLGHSLALHFDIAYYNIQSIDQLTHWLSFEKNILATLFQTEIDVFSFHNTNEYSMTFEEEKYAGMLNTYSRYFKQDVSYCSDSNGYWRYQKLRDVLNDEAIKQLQVLTHPGWWTEDELKPREKIQHYSKMRCDITINNYDKTLADFGRLNV